MAKLTWGERLWAAIDRANNKPEETENVVPSSSTGGRRRTYVREIRGDITDETIGWENKHGNWNMRCAGELQSDGTTSSACERYLKAMVEYSRNRFGGS